MNDDIKNGVPAFMGSNQPEEKTPLYHQSPDGRIAVKLDMMVGDIALVAAAGAEVQTRAVAVFWYPDGSVSIIGCQPKEGTEQMLENALETLQSIA
jgi:hypothetical protein